jgi:hypothetical protein
MANLAEVIRRIRKERDQAQKRIEQLDEALRALTGVSRVGGSNRRGSGAQTSGRRKPMSATARKRIAAAQRARWAKWNAARRAR